jgi:glycosyltransferase involved in cell wall biosynthesis
LHHFMLGTFSRELYLNEWVYNYGEWRRELGEELWRDRARAAIDPRYFRFPMLRRVVERSKGVIVHNAGAAAVARSHGATRVFTIPHFFETRNEMPDAAAVDSFRTRIGIKPRTTLFGIFGYLREPKRILPCVAAFKRLHSVQPHTALLIAGEAVSPDLDRLLSREAIHPAIRRLGHLSDRELDLAAAAVDCCLNLRYPAAGESSGIAMRLMGIGKPVIVTDSPENAGFPDVAVLRVTPGIAESSELFDHMVLVTAFPRIANAIGGEARLHLRERHALETVAREYWNCLCVAAS